MLQTVNGCKIHYEIKHNSKSSETPVLFLHGWGCDANIFADLMEAAQTRATVISLDFPAHGQSEAPPIPWGVGDFAVQVKQLLDNINIVKVCVVAHSFGARVSIYLASQYPQLIEKMIITGGAGIRKPATQQNAKRTSHYKRLSGAVKTLMKIPPLKPMMKGVQNKLIQHYGSADYAKLSEDMRATFVKIISEDLTPLLPKIDAPTLLVWGENDQDTPLWMAQTMEREIKDAGLVVFSGRSHFAFLEESARFILIVKQFLWGGTE